MVGNYASKFYMYAMQPVRVLQRHQEESFRRAAAQIEESALSMLNGSSLSSHTDAVELLTDFTEWCGAEASVEWKKLFSYLLSHCRDLHAGHVWTRHRHHEAVLPEVVAGGSRLL